MRPGLRRTAIFICVLGLAPLAIQGTEPAAPDRRFAAEISSLSEAGGYFDTDNLISNEASYLQVVPALEARQLTGGAYLGVGPDQNFSYIARVRPAVAYIIDIRRDNLLLHLLFKAIFTEAATRAEYLSYLTGRAPPAGMAHATVDELVSYVDRAALSAASVNALRARLDRTIAGFGVPLTERDFETIDRFHRTFIEDGLDLVFVSHGRPRGRFPGSPYPNLRELLLAADPQGRKRSYMASEEDFQFLKALQSHDAIIPVVGDVSGPRALRAVAEAIAARRERVSAFYLSNVEFYLHRDGRFARFIDNLAALPHHSKSVIIRSVFGGGSSISQVQSIDDTLAEAAARPWLKGR